MRTSDIHIYRTYDCFDKIIRLSTNDILGRYILDIPCFIWFKRHCFKRFFYINSQRKKIFRNFRIGCFDFTDIVLTICTVA